MNKLVIIILDGWGLRKDKSGNAIEMAKKPNFDKYWKEFPHASIDAAGLAIGLPEGQIGTSEVNHFIIGAGRIVYQDLVGINLAIKNGSFFKNKAFLSAINHVKNNNSSLHIMGLVSDGGVHSYQDHLYALIRMAKENGLKKLYFHAFTDGRDTLPKSAIKYVLDLENYMNELGIGKIATICGRYFAMDRDHNWPKTDKAFALLNEGKGELFNSAEEAIKASYKKGIADEFIEPVFLGEGIISDNDAVIFANFRNDRPKQLTERFLERGPKNLYFVTMTEYQPDYKVHVAFPLVAVKNCLGEILSKANVKQLRTSETEKFAHVTFFLNCKEEKPFPGEDRILIPSYTDVKTPAEKPYMRARDITQKILEDMETSAHQVIIANICNCDLVGHTGNIPAIIEGVETIDECLGKIVESAKKYDFSIIITADHGNAEEKIDEKTGERLTAHTLNPVPFILISKKYKKINSDHGGLQDIAPTILKILGIPKPQEMTGKSLV